MTNSYMVIMWPNKDGSVTVSQRKASTHAEPQVDTTPPRIAQTDLAISTVSNCISNMFKSKPPGAWRVYFILFCYLSPFKHNSWDRPAPVRLRDQDQSRRASPVAPAGMFAMLPSPSTFI
jgi:hypothetical protein